MLVRLGLGGAWADSQFAVNVGHGAWKDWVAELVDGASNTARTARLVELPSAQEYAHTKHCGRTPAEYAFSTGGG